MARPLIAPAMFTRLFNFYPATVTIQAVAEPQDSYGAPADNWADRAGYVDLECRLAPSGGQEVKMADQTLSLIHI